MKMKGIGKGAFQGVLVLSLTAALGACATMQGTGSDYAGLMSQAEAAVTSGSTDTAIAAFKDAAKADPTRKEPWVRAAQLEFDKGRYARAIVAAEEVLQRDPEDLVADGILTVSGFRIANHALERLQGRGALASETARREAESLATTLKATMGDDILASQTPRPNPPRRPATARPAAAPAAKPSTPAAAPASAPADPFRNIGGN